MSGDCLFQYIPYICLNKKLNSMENIGDWLYMVIIIIAAISSFIGSIKKNKQTAEKRQSREIIVAEDWKKTQTTHAGYEPSDKNKEKDYHTFKKENTNSSLSTEDRNEENATISLEDMPANTDEWRKAFIYNEIFKRKY